MSGQTFIDGERIVLRTVEEDDVPFLHEGVNHPEVRAYIRAFDGPTTAEQVEETLDPGGDESVSLLAVANGGDREDQPVGSVQLHPIRMGDGYANLGVWFHPDAWGNGYALDASAHLIEFGFRARRLHRISATVASENRASRRLCERLGFAHEGTAREAQFADGAHVDVERYGLLVDEWDGPRDVIDDGYRGGRE